MTQDEIIRMAREAGIGALTEYGKEALERFAALVTAHERNRHAWTQEHWTEYEHAIAAAEREACAKVCDKYAEESSNPMNFAENCAAAIRAIKFEGDTGFRPVSEMIAEHKQDPKKAAAIEKAKMRKAKQEPVAWWNGKETAWFEHELDGHAAPDGCTIPLYAAPVRTKDLTDDEIVEAVGVLNGFDAFRAVIAAYKEKNK